MSKPNSINTLADNPLAQASQREKSGSDTYRKYNYQYHWALCRIIEEHEQGNEYALFMEYHDDVVIADSLFSQTATFEFNQVKEVNKTYSASSLTAITGKNSVLGKLLLDSCAKPFCEKIKSINLVSSGGFNLKLRNPNLNLDVITVGHVAESEVTKIKEKLILEIGDVALPEHLAFILPDLQPKDFCNSVKGRIAELIDKMSPNNYHNTVSIYRCLIEDLARKGENTFDYQDWEEALKQKSVTSEQVQEIINKNINRKIDSVLTQQFQDILAEYSFKSVDKFKMNQAFNRYYNRRIGDRSPELMKFSNSVKSMVEKEIENVELLSDLEKLIKQQLPTEDKSIFSSSIDVSAAILYEILS